MFPIGTTTVTCTATDDAGNSASGSFTVHVKGAAEQVADLRALTVGVGPGGSLYNKLTSVLASLAAGNTSDACDTLQGFINEVKAQTGKKVTPAEAATFITAATRIRNVLAC